jgi:hypothetical protein
MGDPLVLQGGWCSMGGRQWGEKHTLVDRDVFEGDNFAVADETLT